MAGSGHMQDDVPKTGRDGEITLTDGTATTPNSVTLVNLEGDYSYNRKQNVTAIKARGSIIGLRKGEDELATFTFSGKYAGLYASGDDPTAYEVLFKEGGAGTWKSTLDDSSDLMAVNLGFKITDPDSSTETITANNFVITDFKLSEKLDGNTFEISGVCIPSDMAVSGT